MSVKVTDNTAAVTSLLTQKASIFLRVAAEEIVSVSQKATPKKSGRLRMDTLKQVLGLSGKVVWQKGYAARQETTQFKNYTTPGTGPHFAENAVKAVSEKTGVIAKKSGLI